MKIYVILENNKYPVKAFTTIIAAEKYKAKLISGDRSYGQLTIEAAFVEGYPGGRASFRGDNIGINE